MGVFIFYFFCIFISQINAQLNDENWVFFRQAFDGDPATILNFKNKKLSIQSKDPKGSLLSLGYTKATYSDSEGELALVCDGFSVYDKDLKLLPNGDSINFGQVWKDYQGILYPDFGSAIFLPDPIDTNLVWLIHRSSEYGPQGYLDYNKLLFTLIRKIEGKYCVISKNNVFFNKSVFGSSLVSIKHANGRDWWIIQIKPKSNTYYFFLLNQSGIRFDHEQSVGEVIQSVENNSNSNDTYSQDGFKIAIYSNFSGIHLFDFDRFKGELSNSKFTPYKWKYPIVYGSVAFSPSGRFLYFNNALRIIQYDLWRYKGELIHGDTVAYHDGLLEEFDNTYYGNMLLGPDGRIYLCTAARGKNMHIIKNPDEESINCNFVPKAFKLLGYNRSNSMPVIPSYRLGPMIGSHCDTLHHGIRDNYKFDLITSPESDRLTIKYISGDLDSNMDLYMYSLDGRLISREFLSYFERKWEIDITALVQGAYIYQIVSRDRILDRGKMIRY
ncbi:MAG: hypothetical protein ABIO44_06995 [Saprospiraceae bacterium]